MRGSDRRRETRWTLEGWHYLDVAQVALLVLDVEGRVEIINRKGCEILGFSAEEVIGRRWVDRFVPDRLREAIRAAHGRLMRGEPEALEYFECPVLTKSGEERLMAWRNSLLRDPEGRIIGSLGSGEDITERRRVEEQLQQSHKDLEDIKHALDQAAIVAITDRRGVIEYVNDQFCRISKYSREELLGQDHRIVNSGYHPKEFFRELWGEIGGGRIWRGEIRNRAKDGSVYWVDTTIVPFLDERGAPYRYMAIRNDITARKEAEAELRNREALHQLGQMAAVVAHEVKNPLAGIAGALQIIGGRLPEDSPDRDVISSILQRTDSLNDRVQDLLLFARPKPPRFGTVRIRPLIQDTATLLSEDPKLSGIEVRISGDEVTMSGDADLLRAVFANLLLNAAQAMDGGGRIEVTIGSGDGACRIHVVDSGPGIAPELDSRVFEPFFTTRSQGTGLGLPIAKRVVEAHGGSIRVDSPPEGGTAVTVCLPLKRPGLG